MDEEFLKKEMGPNPIPFVEKYSTDKFLTDYYQAPIEKQKKMMKVLCLEIIRRSYYLNSWTNNELMEVFKKLA